MSRLVFDDGQLRVSATKIVAAGSDEIPTNVEIETPTYTTVRGNRSITLNMEAAEIDVSGRGDEYTKTRRGRKQATIEFEMLNDTDNSSFDIIMDAYQDPDEDNQAIAVKALDQKDTVTGASGLAGNFTPTNVSRNEADQDAQLYNVTLKAENFVKWYVVS